MSISDKERIIKRYNKRIEKYGHTIEALASGNDERRNMRFQVLLDCGIQKGDRVLDLGCGFGDLYPYLQKSFGERGVEYVGVDINSNIIDGAKERFKGVDFRVLDILEDQLEERFDYIVSTSSFNLKLSEISNYEFTHKLLTKCYEYCDKGIAIDFLTEYVDYRSTDDAFYYSPEKVFSIAKGLTKRVMLRHDYPLFEFCIYMYKDFKGWG